MFLIILGIILIIGALWANDKFAKIIASEIDEPFDDRVDALGWTNKWCWYVLIVGVILIIIGVVL